MGDADYIHAFQSIVMPIAMEFAPELVISTEMSTNCLHSEPTSVQFRPALTRQRETTSESARSPPPAMRT